MHFHPLQERIKLTDDQIAYLTSKGYVLGHLTFLVIKADDAAEIGLCGKSKKNGKRDITVWQEK